MIVKSLTALSDVSPKSLEEVKKKQKKKNILLLFQVFVNFAKQQTGEDVDASLHRWKGRNEKKISPVKRKT